MEPIIWISFDGTVPVPALARLYAVSRESLIELFERGRPLTQLKFGKDGVWIRPEDDTDWDEAERIARIEVEGVDFYTFTDSIFEFNDDTEQMLELGYRAYFVPGAGIVVDNPDTPVATAAQRFIDDLSGVFGKYVPERLNSWAEYATAVPNLERAFALAGVERHEREKQELVATLVDDFLATRAAGLPTEGTVRADEMAVNTVLEATDVRWWSHTPGRELFVVTKVEPAENGMLAVTTETKYGHERTRLVRPDRRFLIAQP
ncbi:hypothetical protein GCM10023063_18800 [Arthrobacter methylotrophus]|uniref:Immunity protein 35 domain-containing protein n=1 Tax=Arthrobacter methylotrophus TaxID=121291 RepID=A0ABV5URJ7_9MICC